MILLTSSMLKYMLLASPKSHWPLFSWDWPLGGHLRSIVPFTQCFIEYLWCAQHSAVHIIDADLIKCGSHLKVLNSNGQEWWWHFRHQWRNGINCVTLGKRGQKEDCSNIYEGNNHKLISGSKTEEGETYSGDNWELKGT